MIAVVDYRKGNLKSVERGLVAAGADARITDDAAVIAHADAIVLPGVGAFADAAKTMRELGQMEAVRARIEAGVPFLGICLGLHLMFEEGEEGQLPADDGEGAPRPRGLGVLPGVVRKIPKTDSAGHPFKVPHVGWNCIEPDGGKPGHGGRIDASCPPLGDSGDVVDSGVRAFDCPLLAGVPAGEHFYFTHSYIAPDGPFSVAHTVHSVAFPSAVQYGEVVFGVQFHPEKSSDAGARVLCNFAEISKGA